MTDRPRPSATAHHRAQDLLIAAQNAANARDAKAMAEALAASGYLDGLVRRLERRWPNLLREDIEDCIGEAVNGAFEAVSTGRTVRQLGAWLWKAADNIAGDLWRRELLHRSRSTDVPEGIAGLQLDTESRHREDALAERRRVEAVRTARRLLPRIGHGQIVLVIELVIEAVEAGLPHLPADTVAATLGIGEAAARSLMSRGLERLRREARLEGVEFDDGIPGEDESFDESYRLTDEESDA